jgi:hypothetical protein
VRTGLRARSGSRRAGLTASVAAALAIAGTVGVAGASAASAVRSIPRHGRDAIGFVNQIQWTSSAPAPGVQVLNGAVQEPNPSLGWTVTMQAPTQSPFDGSPESAEAGSPTWAQTTESALSSDGFTPRADELPWPHYADDPRGEMGVRVRVGQFTTQADATTEAAALTTAGFTPLVEWEGFDPQQPPEAELLHAVIVNPRTFAGRVIATHGSAIASRATVAAQSQPLGALAAVNAGFFTINSALPAVAGVPTGLGVYGGKIESLPNGDRTDLVLNGRRPARIENLLASAQLDDRGSVAPVLGINRQPGSNEDCGVPGFAPTSQPRQGAICSGANDLVWFTPEFGAALPTGPGVQATINGHGHVIAVGTRGGTLLPGDAAIQAIGSDAAWISSHIHIGDPVTLRDQLRLPSGEPFRLSDQTSIVSAAPVLLRDGRSAIDAVREGVFDPRDLFDYGFSAERHGRTIAGVDQAGQLILVTADGIPGLSEGLTLSEEAGLMRTLGAVDAMNLDGGGSTSFVSGGIATNHPSDATGARAIGDSIQIVP